LAESEARVYKSLLTHGWVKKHQQNNVFKLRLNEVPGGEIRIFIEVWGLITVKMFFLFSHRTHIGYYLRYINVVAKLSPKSSSKTELNCALIWCKFKNAFSVLSSMSCACFAATGSADDVSK